MSPLSTSDEDQQPTSAAFRIDADLLIPGRGEPVRDASLVTSGRKIAFVGPRAILPQEFENIGSSHLHVPVLMPGMFDCHAHFWGAQRYSVASFSATSPALASARGVRDLAALLNAGFTSVREVAGYGVPLSKAVNEGWLPGPHIYSAVSLLSPTGGHADCGGDDEGGLPLETLRRKMRDTDDGIPLYVCDGVDDCRSAVRLMRRRGARLIKVCTSGGVASPDPLQAEEFAPEELDAIVKEAARWDMVVAAHCHGERGVRRALEAGCATLEHGSFLDEGTIETMRARGTILVATRAVMEFGVDNAQAWSTESYAKLCEVNEASKRSYAKAIKAGVKIALGTDIGVSTKRTKFNHGMNGVEFKYAVEAGMTPAQAIEAGTAMGPETLGRVEAEAIRSGQLKQGFEADFIALRNNPLEDIELLSNPNEITHVWKSGKLYKSPGQPINILE